MYVLNSQMMELEYQKTKLKTYSRGFIKFQLLKQNFEELV